MFDITNETVATPRPDRRAARFAAPLLMMAEGCGLFISEPRTDSKSIK
jgi:hypothetical protein